jgi:serine/threonine protein kinase
MIGEVVGGYTLVQKMGEGSMGEVFLGDHELSRQKAAVKVLFPVFSKEGTALTRYFAEVRSTHAFGHPGIAQIHDCGMHASGRAFLCMEYLPGKSLAAALADMESVGEIATLAAIGVQVAAALQVVHGKRMVHRALKADSIFLTCPAPNPVVKLLDFGVANFTQSVRQSQTGSLLGAPLYMSPEVGRGLGTVDHRADIYSLGCILFEMATGRPPFVREGAGQLIIAHSTEAPPAVRTLEPSVPAELDELIGRSLRKDPAQRPQSMSEIAAILGRFSRSAVPIPIPARASAPAFAPPVAENPWQIVAPSQPSIATPQWAVPPSQPGIATPSASVSSFLQQAAAMSRASITAEPVDAPSDTPDAEPPGNPRPRILEPTALLQPSEAESSVPPAALSSTQPHPRRSTGGHQPTALLDPPSRPSVAREAPAKRVSRSAPLLVEDPAPRSHRPHLPLIAIGCAIALCAVTLVALLLMRKSPAPKVDTPAATSARPAAPVREEFQPPSAKQPAAAMSAEPVDVPAYPASNREQPPLPAAKAEPHRPHSKSHPASGKPGHARPKDVPLW